MKIKKASNDLHQASHRTGFQARERAHVDYTAIKVITQAGVFVTHKGVHMGVHIASERASLCKRAGIFR